jgi:hypothetical protein
MLLLAQLVATNVRSDNTIYTVATSSDFSLASQGFAFPHVGGDQVFFTAYGAGSNSSLVQAANGKLVTVASTAGSTFTSLSSPAASEQYVAFVGQAASHPAQSIYVSRSPFKGFEAVATVGADDFEAVTDPSIDQSSVAWGGERGGLAGIFARVDQGTAPSGPAVHTLVNASRAQPHRAGAVLRCIEDPSISSAGFVAFFASSCTSLPRSAAEHRPGRMYRTRPRGEHALHLDDDPTVGAGIYLAHVPTDHEAWPARGEARLTVAADFTTHVPGSSSATFVAFSSPVASASLVAFVGSTSDGQLGVFTYDLANGALAKVADTETSVPGAAGATFADFPYAPSVRTSADGMVHVVFYGAAGGSASGLYAYARSSEGAALRKLVTMGDTLGGETIAFLGAGAASSDATTAAFYAVTNTNGIYTVPLA